MPALPTEQYTYTNKDVEKYLPKQQATPTKPTSPNVLDLGDFEIDWNAITEAFRDPRATPAFYKLALGLLTDLLSHQRGMEQLAIQRQVASARDITPLINYTNVLERTLVDMYDKLSTLPQGEFRTQLATQIGQLEKVRNQVYNKILQHFGIPVLDMGGGDKNPLLSPEQSTTGYTRYPTGGQYAYPSVMTAVMKAFGIPEPKSYYYIGEPLITEALPY